MVKLSKGHEICSVKLHFARNHAQPTPWSCRDYAQVRSEQLPMLIQESRPMCSIRVSSVSPPVLPLRAWAQGGGSGVISAPQHRRKAKTPHQRFQASGLCPSFPGSGAVTERPGCDPSFSRNLSLDLTSPPADPPTLALSTLLGAALGPSVLCLAWSGPALTCLHLPWDRRDPLLPERAGSVPLPWTPGTLHDHSTRGQWMGAQVVCPQTGSWLVSTVGVSPGLRPLSVN